mmetsp:Transcript_10421/g.31899  ORF Transcript_10421/g.31899 Transcript_10421/m.31899 type:complete len:152 (-) Transcript_10421:52-507(-)
MAFPLILLRSLRPTNAMEILTAGAKIPSSNERFCARVLGSASFFAACTRVVFGLVVAVAPARRWWREEQPAGLLRARAADREAEPAEALVVAVAIIFVVGCFVAVVPCFDCRSLARRPVHWCRPRLASEIRSFVDRGRPKTGFVREVTTGA